MSLYDPPSTWKTPKSAIKGLMQINKSGNNNQTQYNRLFEQFKQLPKNYNGSEFKNLKANAETWRNNPIVNTTSNTNNNLVTNTNNTNSNTNVTNSNTNVTNPVNNTSNTQTWDSKIMSPFMKNNNIVDRVFGDYNSPYKTNQYYNILATDPRWSSYYNNNVREEDGRFWSNLNKDEQLAAIQANNGLSAFLQNDDNLDWFKGAYNNQQQNAYDNYRYAKNLKNIADFGNRANHALALSNYATRAFERPNYEYPEQMKRNYDRMHSTPVHYAATYQRYTPMNTNLYNAQADNNLAAVLNGVKTNGLTKAMMLNSNATNRANNMFNAYNNDMNNRNSVLSYNAQQNAMVQQQAENNAKAAQDIMNQKLQGYNNVAQIKNQIWLDNLNKRQQNRDNLAKLSANLSKDARNKLEAEFNASVRGYDINNPFDYAYRKGSNNYNGGATETYYEQFNKAKDDSGKYMNEVNGFIADILSDESIPQEIRDKFQHKFLYDNGRFKSPQELTDYIHEFIKQDDINSNINNKKQYNELLGYLEKANAIYGSNFMNEDYWNKYYKK